MVTLPKVMLATRADATGIAEMSRSHIEQGLEWSWTPARVAKAIQDCATNVAVTREGSRLVGFGIMEYGDQRAHLVLLAIDPSRQRRGIGSLLLSWLEKCADTAGIGSIQVEARCDNPGAVAFYKSQGYREERRVRGYYRGIIAAVRLEKSLWPGLHRPRGD